MNSNDTISVLFVDDEEFVLDGLRRQFRAFRSEWDMRFANSGAQALTMLTERPASVVVSDMRMPGMSGVDLLKQVQNHWPESVRIILSGQSDAQELASGLGAIHQFLDKPCDHQRLTNAIRRTTLLAQMLANADLRKVTAGIAALPVLPDSYRNLIALLEDEDSRLDDIAVVVQQDVGLCAKFLQLVNSAFFGLPRSVDTAREAVRLLGLRTIRFITLASHVFDGMLREKDEGGRIKHLWEKSMEISSMAGLIAQRAGKSRDVIERSRLAGFVSLIGRAALIRFNPGRYMRVQEQVILDKCPIFEAEEKHFGASQQVVGAYLLGLWAFEQEIIDSVQHQCTPQASSISSSEHPLAFVHLARVIGPQTGLIERVTPAVDYLAALGHFELLQMSTQEAA